MPGPASASTGPRLPYRSLLLATGARARRLPFGGAPVHVLRTRADSALLREQLRPGRRVAVIGGGLALKSVLRSPVAG